MLTTDFESQMTDLDLLIASDSFDLVKNALEACVQLFDRFYERADCRVQVKEKITTSWGSLPIFIRVDILTKLAEVALKQNDSVEAQKLVVQAKQLFDSTAWPAQLYYGIPMSARLAGLQFLCGERDLARTALQAAQDLFIKKQDDMVNINKADTLIPLAEAYQVISEPSEALTIYRQAVAAAVENPNSRPRAEDLSALCVSMALHHVEPDEALWSRIREIQSNLGDPW
jgi:tetratricopeptide (TPR) repeat protein